MLYPPQTNILETALRTAGKVAQVIFDHGLARVEPTADVERFIRQHAYEPRYRSV